MRVSVFYNGGNVVYLRSVSFCLFLYCQSVLAQSFQPCVVKEYNEELAKTPLAGVEVSASDAGNRVSDESGKLTLRFLTKNVGDHVDGVDITKLGYEIFNTDAIKQWNISGESRPFTIVMCKSERFKKIKDNYSEISSKSYAKQKKMEEEQLEKLRREGKLKEIEYKMKIQELQDEFDKQKLSVRPYIDHFARIDLSDLTKQESQIIGLVKTGQIDSAIYCYKQMRLENQYFENLNSYSKLDEASKMIDEAKITNNKQRDTIFQQICRKNDLLMMLGGKENIASVEKSYKEIADRDTTNLYALSAYSSFLREHHRDRDNLRYLHLIKDCGIRSYHHYLGSMYYAIGFAHFVLNENDSAKVYLEKSLAANDKYCKNDSTEYLYNLSNYYIVMAQIYNRENNLRDAEVASEKALEYTRRIYNINKKENSSTLKMALAFAISYNQNKPSSEIESMNSQYMDLQYSLEPTEEENLIEIVFGTIGMVNLSLNQGKLTQAKKKLKDAIYRVKPLYDKDNQKFGNPLSLLYFFLGSIYYNEQNFLDAQDYLEKGYSLIQKDYEMNKNSQAIEGITMGLMMLGEIKSNFGYPEKADSLFACALENCNLISIEDPIKPNVMRSEIFNTQAEHFIRFGYIDKAISALENKIEIDSIIQHNIPDSCSLPYAWAGRYKLSKLYYQKRRYEDAKHVLFPCILMYSDEVTIEEKEGANLLFADLLVKTGEYKRALRIINFFLDEKDNNKVLLLHTKAICYYAMGKGKKAKRIWDSIKELLPEDILNNSPLALYFNSNN